MLLFTSQNRLSQSEGGTMDIPKIQARLRDFASERDWDQHHSPKNISMALSVEAAELMEIFQWVGAEESRKVVEHPDKLDQVEAEIADICVYAIRLADITGIDLNVAINRKIDQNIEKYPPEGNRHWSF
jgi:NTP pyrophosphatase (non-canonical NTP hydrolase)